MPSDSPRRRAFLALALLPAVPLAAQAPTSAARIDSIFSFASASSPGCAVATARDGKVLFARGYGMADLEHSVPITPESAFYLASVSKQFTAAAIHLLALDGKLSLDDDVRKHVAEFPDYGKPITIRHLIHHTAGLRDYLSLFFVAGIGDFPISNADFLAMMLRQRGLNFPTGTQYSYSNSNYVLLSIIVERVSGKSLRAFAAERIFQPLGMSATVFRDDNSMLIPQRALAYRGLPGSGWAHSVPGFHVVGDGGLFSSVLDLARWESNFWDPRVGGAPWLALTGARGKLDDGRLLAYGAGLGYEVYRGDSVVSHGGGYGGYNTYLMRLPRRRFSVAVLCNSALRPAGQLAQRVVDVFLGDSLAPATAAATTGNGSSTAAVTLSAAELAKYGGIFLNDDAVLLRRVVVENGKLLYRRGPGNESELKPVGGNRFEMVGANLVATFSARADSLRLEVPGEPPTLLVRVKDSGLPPLASYAGTYLSSDLGTTYTVAVADSALTFKSERATGRDRLNAVFADGFSNGFYLARFTRDARGRVTGMTLSAGERARHIRFERQPEGKLP